MSLFCCSCCYVSISRSERDEKMKILKERVVDRKRERERESCRNKNFRDSRCQNLHHVYSLQYVSFLPTLKLYSLPYILWALSSFVSQIYLSISIQLLSSEKREKRRIKKPLPVLLSFSLLLLLLSKYWPSQTLSLFIHFSSSNYIQLSPWISFNWSKLTQWKMLLGMQR